MNVNINELTTAETWNFQEKIPYNNGYGLWLNLTYKKLVSIKHKCILKKWNFTVLSKMWSIKRQKQ